MGMREILFRGKSTKHNLWVEGAFSMKDCDSPFGEMVYNPSIIKYEEPCSGFWFIVDPETVGQFTGLTDKNGKKIFEGDIIQFHKSRYEPYWVGVVSYDIGQYVATGKMPLAYRKPIGGKAFYCPFEVCLSGIDKTTIEVLGNIHDNPELLEVSDDST